MPDPAQVVERVNLQNRNQNQPPVNAAGEYMQELYRLRLQQQSSAASTQPSVTASQQ
jgi:hypothetical protein